MSQIIACSVVVFILVAFLRGLYGTSKGYKISDDIDIGYIRPVKKAYIPKQEKPKLVPVVKKQKPDTLYLECVSALVALGYKKSTAKERVEQILSKHKVSKVEDFLPLAFKKDEET